MHLVTWLQRLARFLSAGSIGFGVYCVLLYVLTEYAEWWYLTSSITALVVNYSITFVLQKLWTFRDTTTHQLWRQSGHYILMVSGFYISNTVLLYVLVEYLGMWYMLAQALISIFLTIVSYRISKRLFSS